MKKHWNKKKAKTKINLIVIGLALVLLIPTVIGFFVVKKIDQKYPWVWMYAADQFKSNAANDYEGKQHIVFTFVDHFEPHEQKTVTRWTSSYREFVKKHMDADGKRPQHTWFWYFSYSDNAEKISFLRQMSELAYEDTGELEIHMHHSGDTEESFTKLMKEAIAQTQMWGGLITAESVPRTTFGFIHGLWSLDNSRGHGSCGVNNELIVLRKLGCYADFTHPSWGVMHPETVNKHYYATDDPNEPKSYERGPEMEVGKPGVGDLLIFNGPSVVRFDGIRPRYDHNDVTMIDLPTEERIDDWVKAGIHVKGRPEWVFVKVHTHSAIERDHEAVLGEWRHKMYDYMEDKYNDGEKYVLHYATAREAYNIAKAAEAGEVGNPNDYRDFLIPPYANRYISSNVPFELLSFEKDKAVIRFDAKAGDMIKVRLRASDVEVTEGAEAHLNTETSRETILDLGITGNGLVGFKYNLIGFTFKSLRSEQA